MNDDERENTDYGYDDRWLQECDAILSGEIPASDLTKEMVRAWLSPNNGLSSNTNTKTYTETI